MATMGTTTISLDTAVRDKLRAYCAGGLSYSDAILRLIHAVEMDRFLRGFEEALDDPDYPWVDVDLEDEAVWG